MPRRGNSFGDLLGGDNTLLMALLGLVVVIVAVMMMTSKSGFGDDYVPVAVMIRITNHTGRNLNVQIDQQDEQGRFNQLFNNWSRKVRSPISPVQSTKFGLGGWGVDVPGNVKFFRIGLWCPTAPRNDTYIYGYQQTLILNQGTDAQRYTTRFYFHNGTPNSTTDPFVDDGNTSDLIITSCCATVFGTGPYRWRLRTP